MGNRQYYPAYQAQNYPELSRRITQTEYQKVLRLAKKLGLKRGLIRLGLEL